MSNIEPTVTRTMHCTSCNAVGVHTIDASMRNEAVLCPACAESGKRSACVVTPIEPTEEQKQAAREWLAHYALPSMFVNGLALLLAEREAKLRKQLTFMEAGSLADYNAFAEALQKEDAYLAEINLINERLAEMREVDGRKSRMLYDRDVVIDTLRARVAELESEVRIAWADCHDGSCEACAKCVDQAKHQRDFATARVAELEAHANTAMDNRDAHKAYAIELEEREAQHLADIEAAKDALKRARPSVEAWVTSDAEDVDSDADALQAIDEVLERLAHYDDAKADAPECNASCGGCDVCALASDVCCKCGEYDAVANQDDDMTRWMCSRCYAKAAEGGEG